MTLRPPKARSSAKESGAAVILVLSLLVLVAVLTLAFLARTRTELVTADIGGRALEARRLAQLAADAIQVQILEATTNDNSPIWASQPGMIRTYSVDGSPSTRYKLFSATSMISRGETYDASIEDSIPENWEQAVGEYVDLNTPEGLRFPIADPAAGNGNVLGFAIGAGETTVPESGLSGLPMPVKWLYVLEDGQLVAPVSSSFGQDAVGRPSQVVRVPGATELNPITGRIAMWTDDETTKININTAVGHQVANPNGIDSPGSFNATPRFASEFDKDKLVNNAPAAGEYQRYRGHPATVSLNAVFPSLDNQRLADLAPRATTEFTSKGGSQDTQADVSAPVLDERLYSTIDELAFSPGRFATSISSREINQKRFFLATRSSSPDLTPFGTPKISLVPNDVDTGGSIAAEEKLAAFSATLRPRTGATSFTPQPYHFVRSDALRPKEDFESNARLYGYLQRMLEAPVIPGFIGDTFPDKFGSRNTRQLGLGFYDYIRASHFTNSAITGSSIGSEFGREGIVYPTIDPNPTDVPLAGFGRMEILTEFGIALIPISRSDRVQATVGDEGSTSDGFFDVREYKAIALWEAFVPGQGFPAYGQDFTVKITGLPNLGIHVPGAWVAPQLSSRVTSRTIDLFPDEVDMAMEFKNSTTGLPAAQRGWGGTLPPSVPLIGPDGSPRDLDRGNGELATSSQYPFFGDSIFVYFPAKSTPAPEEELFELGTFALGALPTNSSPVTVGIEYLASSDSDEPGKILASYSADVGGSGVGPIPKIAFPSDTVSTFTTLDARLDHASRNTPGADSISWQELLQENDVVRTYQPLNQSGDLRISGPKIFAGGVIPSLRPRPEALLPPINDEYINYRCLHSFSTNSGLIYPMQNFPYQEPGQAGTSVGFAFSKLIPGNDAQDGYENVIPIPEEWPGNSPATPPSSNFMTQWTNTIDSTVAITTTSGSVRPGDWDNGTGLAKPGPYINFPDEGHYLPGGNSGTAYLDPFVPDSAEPRSGAPTGSDRFPSAVMFGSLPTGVYDENNQPERPWETLLFNPGPAAGISHFSKPPINPVEGDTVVPDHALLEFFRAPIVRPYALSFPAASSGRINLNSQIVPFTYIRRETALHAALEAERVTIGPAGVLDGLDGKANGNVLAAEFHSRINADVTLDGIRLRFEEGEIYRFPSEICDIYLVPEESSIDSYDENALEIFWEDDSFTGLVGDNERERPYASLYPKLTTKSNSYIVHVRAQVIRKARSGEVDQFDSNVDSVAGEWRGSFHLERALPPSEPGIPDYAQEFSFPTDGAGSPPSLEKFHRIRIERVERFAPALADERIRRISDGLGLPGLL